MRAIHQEMKTASNGSFDREQEIDPKILALVVRYLRLARGTAQSYLTGSVAGNAGNQAAIRRLEQGKGGSSRLIRSIMRAFGFTSVPDMVNSVNAVSISVDTYVLGGAAFLFRETAQLGRPQLLVKIGGSEPRNVIKIERGYHVTDETLLPKILAFFDCESPEHMTKKALGIATYRLRSKMEVGRGELARDLNIDEAVLREFEEEGMADNTTVFVVAAKFGYVSLLRMLDDAMLIPATPEMEWAQFKRQAGKAAHHFRMQREWTLAYIEEQIGIGDGTVNAIEKGKFDPKNPKYGPLVELFGFSSFEDMVAAYEHSSPEIASTANAEASHKRMQFRLTQPPLPGNNFP